MTKIYFAHPQTDYGTPAELKMLEDLKRASHLAAMGCQIINPGTQSVKRALEKYTEKHGNDKVMDFFHILIDASDVIIFTEIDAKDGTPRITAGVASEVEHAWRAGKPVYHVRYNSSRTSLEMDRVRNWKDFQVLSIEETRTALKKIDPDYKKRVSPEV